MSNSFKAILATLLVALVSTILLQNQHLAVFRSAGATEAASVEAADTPLQRQLHQLLLERKAIFDSYAAVEKLSLKYGRGSIRDLSRAQQAALLAGIDLCNTKEERIRIRQDILRLHDIIDQGKTEAVPANSRARLERWS